MNTSEVYSKVTEEHPALIFLSGKTSTGKSTFAHHLHEELNYQIIELDMVVVERIIKPLNLTDHNGVFIEVYRERTNTEYLQLFVTGVRDRIAEYVEQKKGVILEGALANPDTLAEIVSGYPDFRLVYFHPQNVDVYASYVTQRFMRADANKNAGLPKSFWSMVDPEAFQQFCSDRQVSESLQDSIRRFAAQSQKESETRLAHFLNAFPNMWVAMI